MRRRQGNQTDTGRRREGKLMKIIVRPNNIFGRVGCALCGESFEAGEVLAWACDDDADGGMESFGYVCMDCIAAGEAGIKQRVKEWANRVQAEATKAAKFADEVAAERIEVPSAAAVKIELDRFHVHRWGMTREQWEAENPTVSALGDELPF